MVIYNDGKELEYFQAFFGSCFGVALSGVKGGYVLFHILVEDDENWFVSKTGVGSTYWFDDLEIQIKTAREWMDANLTQGDWGYIVP